MTAATITPNVPRSPATTRNRTRLERRRRVSPWVVYPAAAVFVLIVMLPVGYMVSVAAQPMSTAGTMLWPQQWDLSAFIDVWQQIDLAGYLRNSLIVSLSTAVASALLGFGSAYVLARFRFRGREVLRMSLLACYTTPGVVLMIPLYVVYVQIQNALSIHIIGTLPLLVLTYLSFSLPYTIWMLAGYLTALPVEVEEAAAIDGASRLQTLTRVVFPLALPAVAVTAVFSFVLAWNDVLFASVLTTNATRTVGAGMQVFVSTAAEGGLPQWNNLMAAGIITALPAVILFLLIQRSLISGLTAGSVK
jgi:multiple sugar transport system permease protein